MAIVRLYCTGTGEARGGGAGGGGGGSRVHFEAHQKEANKSALYYSVWKVVASLTKSLLCHIKLKSVSVCRFISFSFEFFFFFWGGGGAGVCATVCL